MKHPIAWHEECLKNLKSSLQDAQEKLERAQGEVYRISKSYFILDHQIAKAKELNKDGFDPDKFCKKNRGE